jgi:hypothetical protein
MGVAQVEEMAVAATDLGLRLACNARGEMYKSQGPSRGWSRS